MTKVTVTAQSIFYLCPTKTEYMEILGYISALLIGLSLGLTGSGGSILTVPILVYLIGLNPVLATSYSLFVVGVTSAVGGVRFFRQGLVSFKTVLTFGLPSLLTIYFTRLYVVPALPQTFFEIHTLVVTKEVFLMVLFSLLMVMASLSMIRSGFFLSWQGFSSRRLSLLLTFLEAVFVGLVSGLVGAGGGFLIIPALVLLLRLDMKMAVGTSLVLIASNSLIGFLGDLGHYPIDWAFLLSFSSLAVLGIFVGAGIAHKVDSQRLKKNFGWFVLAMGLFIILKEFFL
ncbi:sulfite exporter TauE/SafE family protein [Rufibacter quisquiliarum]|uniref:Probable membrane transporter protein n=1 Tax=Rufibacter quisquiliarum TaxID=1549639 RepID=A0A839GUL6_9BACT|nr:hypothetical protein [Rufibacter quisquiliarum]